MSGVFLLACNNGVVEHRKGTEHAGRAPFLGQQGDFGGFGVTHVLDVEGLAVLLDDAGSDLPQTKDRFDQLGALRADQSADAENLAAVQVEADVLE